jgi:hypothetical protein
MPRDEAQAAAARRRRPGGPRMLESSTRTRSRNASTAQPGRSRIARGATPRPRTSRASQYARLAGDSAWTARSIAPSRRPSTTDREPEEHSVALARVGLAQHRGRPGERIGNPVQRRTSGGHGTPRGRRHDPRDEPRSSSVAPRRVGVSGGGGRPPACRHDPERASYMLSAGSSAARARPRARADRRPRTPSRLRA